MSKPPKLYQEQLDILKNRGLHVADEAFAIHCLEHHNYYRLSAYRFPFTIPGNPDQFKPGITFQQIWNLYCFDRNLRQMVLEACKRVEISVRSRWSYEVGHQLGPLAYLENHHFKNPLIHARAITKLDGEMQRSKEEFIEHHQNNLGMQWPPSWVLVEVASFGTVSNLVTQLMSHHLRQVIATTYQLDERIFCSLFHHLSVLRNTAAHHSRLWNRKFAVTFQLPRKKPAHLWANFSTDPQHGTGKERKIYNSLVLLVHLLQVIEPTTHWPHRLCRLLQSLDPALITDMGCPHDWQARPIWQGLVATGATP
jgi:abortive infection bacteriophage resistance protein